MFTDLIVASMQILKGLLFMFISHIDTGNLQGVTALNIMIFVTNSNKKVCACAFDNEIEAFESKLNLNLILQSR